MIEHGVKMHRGDHGREVRGRLVEAEVLAIGRVVRRQADLGIDDQMPELVRDDVEIEAEGMRLAGLRNTGADFHEAKAGCGVVQRPQQGHLEGLVLWPEMPGNVPAEVPFPDVEGEADRAIGMGGFEIWRADLEMVEMAVGVGIAGARIDPRQGGRTGRAYRRP